jgi:hypothetical protein
MFAESESCVPRERYNRRQVIRQSFTHRRICLVHYYVWQSKVSGYAFALLNVLLEYRLAVLNQEK